MTDDEIDTSDIPELTEEFFKRATVRGEGKNREPVNVTVAVDPIVLSWYRGHGQDWERLANAALRDYLLAHLDDEPVAVPAPSTRGE